MPFNPRGRIVTTNRPLSTRGGIEIQGRKPLLIVYVKLSKRHLADFFGKASRYGLQVEFLDKDCPVFQVCGMPHTLEKIEKWACVLRVELPVAAALPNRGSGAGEKPKRRPAPAAPADNPPLPGESRIASFPGA